MSKVKLQRLLTKRLRLARPEFRLERIGSKLAGSIISETFARKSDWQRQRMIRDVLAAELGETDSVLQVGTLLAYSPLEWNIDLPDAPIGRPGRERANSRRRQGAK